MLYLNNDLRKAVLDIQSSYEIDFSVDRIEINEQFDLIQAGTEFGFQDAERGMMWRDSIEGAIGCALIMGHKVTINGKEIIPSQKLLDWWGDLYEGSYGDKN